MISVESLTKQYGAFTAVDDVSFTAATGRVTGFLGPNGAGKSTTMRIMVGLTRPTTGRVTITGRDYRELRQPGPGGRRPAGRLRPARRSHRPRDPRHRRSRPWACRSRGSTETLARVGLTDDEAGRRVRNYSLGMRQRLGLATALIGDPEVLILDEPANGLDPAGIRWMRDLLRGFADNGGTVLLSSHLLHEIEVIADDLVVIGQGRIVAQGTKAELLAAAGTLVRTTDHRRPSPVPCARPAVTTTRSTAACASTPTPSSWARRRTAPASSCASCAPPTAPAWRRCSSSSPPRPPVKEQQHEHRPTSNPGPRRRRRHPPNAPPASYARSR